MCGLKFNSIHTTDIRENPSIFILLIEIKNQLVNLHDLSTLLFYSVFSLHFLIIGRKTVKNNDVGIITNNSIQITTGIFLYRLFPVMKYSIIFKVCFLSYQLAL